MRFGPRICSDMRQRIGGVSESKIECADRSPPPKGPACDPHVRIDGIVSFEACVEIVKQMQDRKSVP